MLPYKSNAKDVMYHAIFRALDKLKANCRTLLNTVTKRTPHCCGMLNIMLSRIGRAQECPSASLRINLQEKHYSSNTAGPIKIISAAVVADNTRATASVREDLINLRKPGAVNRALFVLTLPCFFLWIRFLLCWAFLFSRLILPGFSCLFRHTIKFKVSEIIYLWLQGIFFPFFHVVLSAAATVQPEYK